MDSKEFSTPAFKRSRWAYTIECAFEYFIALLVSDVFLATLLAEMGIPDSVIGVISSLISFAFLFQLFSMLIVQHIRNVKLMDDGSFEERAHLSSCGSIDMYEIVKALVSEGFDGYVRPDHGRMIWGETGKPGYGLFDRALGATYINGLFEALEKSEAK